MMQTSPIDKDVFMEYVKAEGDSKRDDYYSRVFDKLEVRGKTLSWNWSAFFAATFWLAYRRMYFYALLCMFFEMFLGFIPSLILGAFGNAFYLRWIKNRIQKGISPSENNTDSRAVWYLIAPWITIFLIVGVKFVLLPIMFLYFHIDFLYYFMIEFVAVILLVLLFFFPFVYLGWRACANRK